MSYDYFSCSKTTSSKIYFYKLLLDVFCKNSPKFHFEGSDGWSLTTVRCFAPAEVKASNPFWREQWRGCLRAALAKHLETPWTKQEHSLGCLHPRLCFFLTKVARIHIRYKEKTLIKFSGLQLNNQLLIATSVVEISQDAHLLAGVGEQAGRGCPM